MRPTVKDVAARAGVSPKTVSNVVNGVVFVRPDTRERVDAAIAELGYVPNFSARGLRNGRSGVIALAMPDLGTPYSAEMTHAFVELAHDQGWGVQLEETGAERGRAFSLISRARAHLVDGLVLNPITVEDSEVLGTDLPPIVMIGEVQQHVADQVGVDSIAAAREMTEHLLSLGHRRILVVGTPGGVFLTETARLRMIGYRQALEAAGVPHDPALEIAVLEWTPADAAAAVTGWLADHQLPDAIFCFTDSMAIGALSALWSAGLRAPDDIAVAGFDDVADGRYAVPPLTTVGFDKAAFAQQTLDLLVRRMSERDAPLEQVIVPHEVIVRASTAPR